MVRRRPPDSGHGCFVCGRRVDGRHTESICRVAPDGTRQEMILYRCAVDYAERFDRALRAAAFMKSCMGRAVMRVHVGRRWSS